MIRPALELEKQERHEGKHGEFVDVYDAILRDEGDIQDPRDEYIHFAPSSVLKNVLNNHVRRADPARCAEVEPRLWILCEKFLQIFLRECFGHDDDIYVLNCESACTKR